MKSICLAISAILWLSLSLAFAQTTGKTQMPATQSTHTDTSQEESSLTPNSQAEEELQKGTALTRHGHFSEAIPHLIAARARVSNEFAASFNLSLCYVGTRQYEQAIDVLNDLRSGGHDGAEVENLLAQAYIGIGRGDDALAAFKKAATIAPQNEKLYLLVAEACVEHQEFSLGLKVADIGLQNLPQSARLHYERGTMLSAMDQFDRAKADFALASKLGQSSDIGYISGANEALLSGDVAYAASTAREGLGKYFENPILLTILGEALWRSGVAPGDPAFQEARTALEKAVVKRPNDATAEIALGQIYLALGQFDDAIAQLESARQMQPDQPSVYASLAKAYQRRGDSRKAEDALAMLEKLNQAQAERIRSAPGDRKMSYSGDVGDETAPPHRQ